MRRKFYQATAVVLALHALGAYFSLHFLWGLVLFGPLIFIGFLDVFTYRQTIRRNFPIIGRFRYLFELIRPEIQQYFIESNTDGVPFNRENRSVIYQRAKKELDTLPFGTQYDVYAPGYEWVNHSLQPTHVDPKSLRVSFGSKLCTKPYSASIFNISAMSYGALSDAAIKALNGGAKDGGFCHNTGEGGLSDHHLEPGGDLIWQIGTGYFGCRNTKGNFDPSLFKERVSAPQVRMIEIKLSQGAKPGHGGILPKGKVTAEIARIRNVPMGQAVISPPAHTAFSTPIGLLEFVQQLRELSGGRPVGFKLCLGKRREFLAICKAIVETKIYPDFITVDGGEGGTGAAPLEFSNHVGTPLTEALIFVRNALVGFDIKNEIRIISSGKVISGFQLIKRLALGADTCNSARAMMMAVGCIQALRCNSNECPTGVATQNRELISGIHIPSKRQRVKNFQESTVESVAELLGAMAVKTTKDLRPWHIMRRVDQTEIRHYGELYKFLKPGDLLKDPLPEGFTRAMNAATAARFDFES